MDALLRPSCRTLVFCLAVLTAVVAVPAQAYAGQMDLTLFLGRAYPVYDERLLIRPSPPSLPGVDITVSGDPVIRADGGLVFGGALAFELGVFGIEGRVDGTEVDLDFSGARYDLRATQPPFTGVTGSVTLGAGSFDIRRFYLLSGNVRLRTPGGRHRGVGRSQRAARPHDIRNDSRVPRYRRPHGAPGRCATAAPASGARRVRPPDTA